MARKNQSKPEPKERSMSFINMPLGDARDKEVLPEGEYELIIEDASLRQDESGIMVRCSVNGYPDAKAVFHNIAMINETDDEEKRNNKLLFTRAFLQAFELEFDKGGFDLEAFPGARATVFLKQEEYQGVVSNRIRLTV